MPTSQNGYPVLFVNHTTGALPRLRKWVIPGTGRHLYARDGSAGFLLAHVAHWFNANVEKIGSGTWDDWGWAVRPIRGRVDGYSNHASGTAVDINATQHPRGRAASATFSRAEIARIHKQLETYEGVIRWGGDYKSPTLPDAMHFEIVKPLAEAERVARLLWQSVHGKPVIDANPSAADVIWDGNVPGDGPPDPKPTAEKLAADWSYAKDRIHAPAAKAAGLRGVGRYFSGNPDKDIDDAERKRLHAAGLWVFPFWEKSAGRATEGKAAGVLDVQAAERQADSLGWPLEDVIVYTVDQDVKFADVEEYFTGLNAGNRRPVGVYGSGQIVDDVMNAGLAEYGVEAGSTSWGGGHRSTRASMRQRTTHSVSIRGSQKSDWDEILILPGRPVVPVWNPGEKAEDPHKPPPPPPPPPVPDATFIDVHFNSQRTDSGKVGTPQLREVIKSADLIALNEVESLWQRLVLKTSPKFGMFPTLGARAYDPILWRKSRFKSLETLSTKAYDGKRSVTPSAYVNEVLLTDLVTGKTLTRINAHPPAHIEQAGRERVYKGAEIKKYDGQLDRAKAIFTLMAMRTRLAVQQGSVVVSADTNVSYAAEQKVPVAKRVSYFPLTMLGAVAKAVLPSKGGSHGSRSIDQKYIKGAITSVRAWYGKQEASDHKPVYNELELT